MTTRYAIGQPVIWKGREHVVERIEIHFSRHGSFERYQIRSRGYHYPRFLFVIAEELRPVPAPACEDATGTWVDEQGRLRAVVGGRGVHAEPGRWWIYDDPLRDFEDFDEAVVAAWEAE